MRLGDPCAPSCHRSVEAHKVGVLAERGGERVAARLVPTGEHLLVKTADRRLIGCLLAVLLPSSAPGRRHVVPFGHGSRVLPDAEIVPPAPYAVTPAWSDPECPTRVGASMRCVLLLASRGEEAQWRSKHLGATGSLEEHR
jgi:hypothetical protein